MNKLNRVLKNINVLNILLLALAIVMFFTLAYPLLSTETKIDIPKVEKEPGSNGGKTVSKNIPAVLDIFVLDADHFYSPPQALRYETGVKGIMPVSRVTLKPNQPIIPSAHRTPVNTMEIGISTALNERKKKKRMKIA